MDTKLETEWHRPGNLYCIYAGSGYTRHCKKRIQELSQPRTRRSVWIRTLGTEADEYVWRQVNWGDQESLWPVARATLSATATPRIEQLAEPKRDFEGKHNPQFAYSCGRQSVIWKVAPGATKSEPTNRTAQLAIPRPNHALFVENRPSYVFDCTASPIWSTTDLTRKYANNEHISKLATSRPPHPEYQPMRDPRTAFLSTSAQNGSASERTEALAAPRAYAVGPYRDAEWPVKHYWKDDSDGDDEISENAMSSHPKKRLWELAGHKAVHEEYTPARSCLWNVSKSTLRATPSKRVLELATPQYIRSK